MLKSSDTVKLIVSAFIITSILITFPAPTQAKDTKSCISKTMPWEDASACVSKTKKSSTPVVLGASTASTANKPASLNSDVIFDMINAHRASIGLPAYQKDERICQVARERGPELYNEIFVTGNIHGGFYARNLPYWATENMIHQPSEQAAFNWWMSSGLHRRAIESSTYTHSCGECWGNSCAQIFTAFQPK